MIPMRDDLRRVRAIAKKEVLTFASYRLNMLMNVVNVWYFAISFYFIGEFVGDPDSIAHLDGGYFEFVLVGSIVVSFATVGVGAFSGLIGAEQNGGTLEAVLTTSTPMWTLLVGSFVMPIAFVVVETVVLVGVGLGVFGSGIPLVGLFAAIPALLLTTVSFAPIGVLSASFVVLVKRGDPFSGPIRQLILLMSGALYPVSVLPGWLEATTKILPATYGVRATRQLVQGDVRFVDTLDEMAVLAVFTVVALPISIATFRWSITKARSAGTLGTY